MLGTYFIYINLITNVGGSGWRQQYFVKETRNVKQYYHPYSTALDPLGSHPLPEVPSAKSSQ